VEDLDAEHLNWMKKETTETHIGVYQVRNVARPSVIGKPHWSFPNPKTPGLEKTAGFANHSVNFQSVCEEHVACGRCPSIFYLKNHVKSQKIKNVIIIIILFVR